MSGSLYGLVERDTNRKPTILGPTRTRPVTPEPLWALRPQILQLTKTEELCEHESLQKSSVCFHLLQPHGTKQSSSSDRFPLKIRQGKIINIVFCKWMYIPRAQEARAKAQLSEMFSSSNFRPTSHSKSQWPVVVLFPFFSPRTRCQEMFSQVVMFTKAR